MPTHYSLGLIGYPLEHSLSPVMHKAALRTTGLTGSYSLFLIPPLPEGKPLLLKLFERFRHGELQGLNVTIPHKEIVLPLLDDLTPTARSIGAVNALYRDSGYLVGDNTDARGFQTDLATLPLTGEKKAIVLGAGGAARAVVYVLLQEGWQVHVASRRADQAARLADTLSDHATNGAGCATASLLDAISLRERLSKCSLIVNATPAGMSPHICDSPWPTNLPFPKDACLYDLIYNPAETSFMRFARASGLPSRNGLGMLVEQAALSFELWTGQTVSRDAILSAIPDTYQYESRREV